MKFVRINWLVSTSVYCTTHVFACISYYTPFVSNCVVVKRCVCSRLPFGNEIKQSFWVFLRKTICPPPHTHTYVLRIRGRPCATVSQLKSLTWHSSFVSQSPVPTGHGCSTVQHEALYTQPMSSWSAHSGGRSTRTHIRTYYSLRYTGRCK